jgi:hypothetical protein
MRIKISQSSLISGSWNVLPNNNNNPGEKVLINTILENLVREENHFSIFIPGKRWIQIRCTRDRMELEIYRNLGGTVSQ